ncbi:MAG: polysaccharide biosynthesis protein [Clostridia bacterium]|nr:polysaccharide biosynthesis protein [Clostridia bacterium]
MEKSKGQSFIKGAAILGIAGLIVKIIGAVFRIPLANTIGSEGMSYYEVVYPYYSWLLVISSAGLPTAISKLVAERVTLNDYRGAKDVFNRALILLCGIGIVTTVIMFFGADMLANISANPKAALSFRALSPALLFVSIMCAYRGYLQGLQQMSGTAVSQVVEQVIKLVLGLSLAFALLPNGPEYAAMGALIGVAVSELVALVVIWFMARKSKRRIDELAKLPTPLLGSKLTNVTRSLLAIAIPITLGASISPLTGILDSAMILRTLQFNLGFTLKESQTAYSLLRTNVTTLINMPGVLTMSLAMSLVPAISAARASKDASSMMSISRLGLKLALVIGVPCAVGLFILGKPIMGMLYTSLNETELLLAGDLMRTASLGVLFLSIVQSMTGVIQGMGKPVIPVVNLFIGFILKLITMLILMNIPQINIQGAAVSTVVCYAFAGIADMIYAIRFSKMSVKLFDVFVKPIAASAVMGVICALLFNAVEARGHETTATILAVGAAVIVYVVLIFALKMFSREELAMVPGGRKLTRVLYGGRKNG